MCHGQLNEHRRRARSPKKPKDQESERDPRSLELSANGVQLLQSSDFVWGMLAHVLKYVGIRLAFSGTYLTESFKSSRLDYLKGVALKIIE